MSGLVKLKREGDVATITLDRPDGNRLTNAMAATLSAHLDASRDARLVVLRGAGADFCIGRDMAPPPPGARVTPRDVMREDTTPILDLFTAFRRMRQPVLCAAQGRAWGIGTVFAALVDLTLAEPKATFRLGELERGIPPAIAMSALLDRMPRKALAHLVLSAEPIDAQSALAAGIVSRVTAPDALDAELARLVERLLGFGDAELQAVKAYIELAPRHDFARAAEYGASLLANVLASR